MVTRPPKEKKKQPSTELVKLSPEAVALQQKAETFAAEALGYVSLVDGYVIETQEELNDVNEFLKMINGKWKFFDEERQISVRPALDEQKRINEWFKPALTRLKTLENQCRDMVSRFALKQAQERQRLLEEAKKAETTEEKVALVTQASNVPDPVPTKGVSTQVYWTYEVLDEEKVPDDLKKKVLDHDLIVRRIDAGAREIEGIRIYQDARVSRVSNK